jgi:hypothetical protein
VGGVWVNGGLVKSSDDEQILQGVLNSNSGPSLSKDTPEETEDCLPSSIMTLGQYIINFKGEATHYLEKWEETSWIVGVDVDVGACSSDMMH